MSKWRRCSNKYPKIIIVLLFPNKTNGERDNFVDTKRTQSMCVNLL
jgi:hypothetical protein